MMYMQVVSKMDIFHLSSTRQWNLNDFYRNFNEFDQFPVMRGCKFKSIRLIFFVLFLSHWIHLVLFSQRMWYVFVVANWSLYTALFWLSNGGMLCFRNCSAHFSYAILWDKILSFIASWMMCIVQWVNCLILFPSSYEWRWVRQIKRI